MDEQPLHYILPFAYELKQENKQNYVDYESYQRRVSDPHQREGWDMEEEKLSDEEKEGLVAFLL